MKEVSNGHAKAVEKLRSRTGRSSLTKVTFNRVANDNHIELKQFKMEASNIFLTKHFTKVKLMMC